MENEQFLLCIGIDELFCNVDSLVDLTNVNNKTVVFAVFGTERDFEVLAEATDVAADATFTICPRPHKQYCTMHTKFGSRSIPRLRVINIIFVILQLKYVCAHVKKSIYVISRMDRKDT